MQKPIRRTAAERAAAIRKAAHVAGIAWVVVTRTRHSKAVQSRHFDVNEARAEARALQRATRIPTWVEVAA